MVICGLMRSRKHKAVFRKISRVVLVHDGTAAFKRGRYVREVLFLNIQTPGAPRYIEEMIVRLHPNTNNTNEPVVHQVESVKTV